MKKGFKDLFKKGIAITMAAVLSMSVGVVSAFAAETEYTGDTIIYNISDITNLTANNKVTTDILEFKDVANSKSAEIKWSQSESYSSGKKGYLEDGPYTGDSIKGVNFTRRIKPGGSSSSTGDRSLSMKLSGACTVDFYVAVTNEGEDPKAGNFVLKNLDGSYSKEINVSSANGKTVKRISFDGIETEGNYTLTLSANRLILFAIAVTPTVEEPGEFSISGTVDKDLTGTLKCGIHKVDVQNDKTWVVSDLQAKEYKFTYTGDDYVLDESTATVTITDSNIENHELKFNEIPKYTISGTIKDENGNAVRGVTIAVNGSDLTAETDENGAYTLGDAKKNIGFKNGSYKIVFEANDNYDANSKDIAVSGANVTNADMTLEGKSYYDMNSDSQTYTPDEPISSGKLDLDIELKIDKLTSAWGIIMLRSNSVSTNSGTFSGVRMTGADGTCKIAKDSNEEAPVVGKITEKEIQKVHVSIDYSTKTVTASIGDAPAVSRTYTEELPTLDKVVFGTKTATNPYKIKTFKAVYTPEVEATPTIELTAATPSSDNAKVALKGIIKDASVNHVISKITVKRGTKEDFITVLKKEDDGTFSFTAEYTKAPTKDTNVTAEITYADGSAKSQAVTVTAQAAE